MKHRKWISIAASGAMVLSLLAACSKGESTGGEATVVKSADGKEMLGNMYTTGLPIVKDKVTLKMIGIMTAGSANFADMPFFKQLEEKTNVHIEWENYPEVGYGDRKNLLLAANELPDAFFGMSAFSMEDANKFGPKGTVIPLDALIDKYAPNYKEALKKMPLMDGLSTAFDGKKYTMGTVIEQEVRSYPDNLYINKKWLDKLGLQPPTTIDEYYNVLKAFKDGDPNGNGKKDEIPFTFTKWNHITGYGSLFGAYGMVDVHNGSGSNPSYDHFIVDNGKVMFTADKPEYKEAVKGLSRFFKDGLFDKEGFTQDQNQFNAKMKDPVGVVGSFYAWSATAAAPQTKDDYIALAPLKGPGGKEPVVKKRNNHINVMGSGFAISSTNKHPEITMRWVDEFYKQLTSIEAQWGPVGTGLIDKGNGTYDFNKEAPQGVSYLDMFKKYSPVDNAPKFLPKEFFGKVVPVNEADKEKQDVINKYYSSAKKNETLPQMNYTGDEVKLITSIGMDITNYVKDRQTAWLLNGGIDEGWNDYLAKLKQLKAEEYMKTIQTAYERNAGKK
ncbi:extracellular solute-binding protein [Paenibacillus silviterrae]|uniref:extracellular solute-binding protein n=1 Tax=Paenibacillus silviterrae TaxID=3242194 RepID=UPI0025433141|nr:extracellular solute-binding protein [Paenibacillus chinjuensis]